MLADDWARARGGAVLALIVDHRLRAESAEEAALVQGRLMARGIAAEILTLPGLARGAGLAARARAARYAALLAACASHGIVHLLVGHHAADQAETLVLRRAAGSGKAGLAGMSAIVEHATTRLLRPLLDLPPERLRATLLAAGWVWVEDPSNRDPVSARVRVRRDMGAGRAAHLREAGALGQERMRAEPLIAAVLAARASLYPEGYAVLSAGALPSAAMAALLRVIAGRAYAPTCAALAARPHACTKAGVRMLPAGRLGPPGAWLLAREAGAVAPPVPAWPGALWDGRFRITGGSLPAGAMLGALGEDAPALRARRLPDAVARVLPALRVSGKLVAVPHLGYSDGIMCSDVAIAFEPPMPLAGGSFVPAEMDRP